MNISELPALLFRDVFQRWKRRTIVFAICAVCALGIAIEAITIGRILLERAFGPIGGRLLVAGILGLILITSMIVLMLLERRGRLARAAETAQATGDNDPRVALIAQAINLGYTFARGFGSEKPDPPTPPPQEDMPERSSESRPPAAQAAE